jgi:GNAT superfamily N-acetyltransferase
MVLFPEHDEFSTSAVREGCAEVRDVFVARPRRRLGVATALMRTLEDASPSAAWPAWGCRCRSTRGGARTRALRAARVRARARSVRVEHGSARDDGPVAVGAVMDYLVKEL